MSLADRAFLKWWNLPPGAQVVVVLAVMAVWAFVGAWRRESGAVRR